MSARLSITGILTTTLLLAGCGGMAECDKPRVYQQAARGKHIETPDGMDPLPSEREMTIPEASPQAPPPPGQCIDAPPTLSTEVSGN